MILYNFFKSELKRAIFSRYFLISFLITFILLAYSFLDFISLGWSFGMSNFQLFKEHYDFIDLFLISRSENKASYLGVVAPLLACLVFSDSYLSDKTTGYLNFIFMRISKKKYVITRLLVNSIASGLSILLSSIFMICILLIFYGFNINSENALYLAGPFSNIYYSGDKYLYLLIVIGILVMFNFIFSTLSLGISAFIHNKYISFLAPFLYYIASGALLGIIGLYKLDATALFMPKNSLTTFELILYQFVLVLLGVTTFIYGVLNLNEQNN